MATSIPQGIGGIPQPINAHGNLTVTITNELGDVVFRGVASPKVFSSGSEGWNASDKLTTQKGIRYQVGLNLTEIGSVGRHKVSK